MKIKVCTDPKCRCNPIHRLNESQVMADEAKAEFDAMSEEEQQKIREDWDSLPEWKKQDLRDEIEMDML